MGSVAVLLARGMILRRGVNDYLESRKAHAEPVGSIFASRSRVQKPPRGKAE